MLPLFQLEEHDSAKVDTERGFRSLQEMEQEAKRLATFFPDLQ